MYKRSLPSEAVEGTSHAKKLRMQDGSAANGASKLGDGLIIDEDLHSRQLAVYGRESMRRMAASNVLIVGALGLGVEVGEDRNGDILDILILILMCVLITPGQILPSKKLQETK